MTATSIVAIFAYIFRVRIKRFFLISTLKSKNNSPSLSFDIDSTKNSHNEWTTHFLIENMGNIDATKLRIFLCSYNFSGKYLTVKSVKIEGQRKWINNGGQRVQINTQSLHDGCNLTEDQRYFVEFIDSNDGTIYRMAKGAPSAKDGTMAFYGTAICGKRLPKKGIQVKGVRAINRQVKKYDIDLAIG